MRADVSAGADVKALITGAAERHGLREDVEILRRAAAVFCHGHTVIVYPFIGAGEPAPSLATYTRVP